MTTPLHRVLSDEGFRIFFPLAALYAALWPLAWVALWGFDLPFAREIPPGVWHANEMVFGAWGAALLGFLTTAAPEWTDTPRLRGGALWVLAALWGAARIAGLVGADALVLPAMLADMGWLVLLIAYLLQLTIRQRSTRVVVFAGWLFALAVGCMMARRAMLAGDGVAAAEWLRLAGLTFLGLLSLALSRITVPITNIVLDPSERRGGAILRPGWSRWRWPQRSPACRPRSPAFCGSPPARLSWTAWPRASSAPRRCGPRFWC